MFFASSTHTLSWCSVLRYCCCCSRCDSAVRRKLRQNNRFTAYTAS